MRLEIGKCRDEKPGDIHGNNEAAPISRNESRIDNIRKTQGSQANMSNDPSTQPIETICQQVSSWSPLSRMHRSGKETVQCRLKEHPTDNSKGALVSELRTTSAHQVHEAFPFGRDSLRKEAVQ